MAINEEITPWIKIPILNDEYFVVVIFGSLELVSDCLKEYEYPDYSIHYVEQALANKRGACFYGQGCHPVIAMPRRPYNSESWGTLAHEACHAVEYILDSIKQLARDEIMAHSVGAVVRIAGDRQKKI